MYKRILIPLEHSEYDQAILTHVRELARTCDASLLLIHVADGWVARNIRQLASGNPRRCGATASTWSR